MRRRSIIATPAPKLSASAQSVITQAEEAATQQDEHTVDTEHLLLGLLSSQSGRAAGLLKRHGASASQLKNLLAASMTRRRISPKQLIDLDRPSSPCPPPMADRANDVILLASQEARRMENSQIEPEHLLLGLLLIGKGKASAALRQAGLNVESIRHEIAEKKLS